MCDVCSNAAGYGRSLKADSTEEELTRTDSMEASWFASNRLKYASGWLNAIPSLPCFQVSSQVFQVMLCLRVLAPIAIASNVDQCPCGYRFKPLLANGTHWLSSCYKHSYVSYRHNLILPIMRRMFKELGYSTLDGETANWLPRRRSLRPFGILSSSFRDDSQDSPDAAAPDAPSVGGTEWIGYDIGIADPTRVGRLPPGVPYYQRGTAAARIQRKKITRFRSDVRLYGPLTKPAKFVPFILEVTGGFGPIAAAEFSGWAKDAAAHLRASGEGNYRAEGEPHTWNALIFANLYSQMITFSIMKANALSIVNAVEAAARADQGLQGGDADGGDLGADI